MNILVTGGTGFVGKPLVESLLSRGDTVTVLTRSIEKAQSVFSKKNTAIFDRTFNTQRLEYL